MTRQKGELRLVVRHGDRYGLIWQATLERSDLYATTPFAATPEKGLAPSRVSYHASGQGHIYVGPDQARLIGPPSQPLTRIIGKEKVAGWTLPDVRWDYRPKRDARHRRTLILEVPLPGPPSVDLWVLQAGCGDLVDEVLADYRQMQILGQLHVAVTSPQLFAVAYTMSGRGRASLAQRIAQEHQA